MPEENANINNSFMNHGTGHLHTWVVDRIPIMYVTGGVDFWTCGPVGCGLWTEYP